MPGYLFHHTVTFDETNLVGNVYFAHYLHWQGHCREQFLFDHVPSVVAGLQDGSLALVTASCEMTYHDEAFARDEIVIEMTPRETAGHRMGMHFAFRRAEQLLATGSQTVACMQREGTALRPVPLPVELVTAAGRFR